MANKANVGAFAPRVGGGIFFGPTTAELPTSATDELTIRPDAFTDLGYITADGLTETIDGLGDGEQQTAWGGAVLRVISGDGATHTFGGALYEVASVDAAKALYGEANVNTTASGYSVAVAPGTIGTIERAFVIDTIDKTSKKFQRIVIPSGVIYPSGDAALVSTELNSVEFTIEAHAGTDGVSAIKYFDTVTDSDDGGEDHSGE